MKKFISLILMVLSLFCLTTAVGCGGKVISYTVTLDANGGTLDVSELTFEVGKSYELPAPTKEGYTFKGWSNSLNNITSSTTLTAQYTINNANNIFDI